MDCSVTNKQLSMLHNSHKSSSVCTYNSGPLTINSDPEDSSDLMFNESENSTYVSNGNCDKNRDFLKAYKGHMCRDVDNGVKMYKSHRRVFNIEQ